MISHTQIFARTERHAESVATREISVLTARRRWHLSCGCFGIGSTKRIKHPLIIAMLKPFIESRHKRESNPSHNHADTCSSMQPHTHTHRHKRGETYIHSCTDDFDSDFMHTSRFVRAPKARFAIPRDNNAVLNLPPRDSATWDR